MKSFIKSFIVLALLVFAGNVNAQNIKIYSVKDHHISTEINNGDTIVMQPTTDTMFWTEIPIYIYAKNTKSSDMILMAKKNEISFLLENFVLESHRFCFAGQCYSDMDYISPLSSHLKANEIDTSFSGYYGFETESPIRTEAFVSYTFYDSINESDSTIVYVHYKTALKTGINENESARNPIVLEVYPNPAENVVTFNYDLKGDNNASLIVYNTLGAVVKQQLLNNTETKVEFDTKELTSGIYYYAVKTDNYATKSNKLVVVH